MLSSSYSEAFEQFKTDTTLLEMELIKATILDRENPLNTMETQPADFMFWGYLAAKAEYEEARLKAELKEVVLPAARMVARDTIEAKRPTKDQIDDLAYQNEKYRETSLKYIEAQRLTQIMKKAEEAMKQRKDMLQSINSRQKAELG